MITSSQNPKLKLVRALQGRPKERREAGAFLIEGVRLVEEALSADWPIRFVLYSDGLSDRGEKLIEKLKSAGFEVENVAGDLLQSVSETETSQGILAVLELTDLPLPNFPNFILIPDQIRDPGNLGTLIRSAAAAGVQAILLTARNHGCICAESCPRRDGGAFSTADPQHGMGRDRAGLQAPP